jgi:hypothetical protein
MRRPPPTVALGMLDAGPMWQHRWHERHQPRPRENNAMAVSVNLDAVLDPEFQSADLTDLVNAPVTALSGVSEAEAEGLRLAFGIETIADLAANTFVRAAVAIADMARVAQ